MIHVPGYGPSTAKFVLCGEAPGADEESSGIPFSGKSGKIVDDCLAFAGVPRDQVYLTNVVKVRPPDNDIKRLHQIGYNISDFMPQFEEEIRQLNPNCILAIGNTALQALTGYTGIKKYRGSILKSYLGPKVVGTIHPASILHAEGEDKMLSWKDLTYIKWDFARAYEESKNSTFDPPHRNLIVCRSNLDLYRFLNRNSDRDAVSVDIETFRTIPICIGLAFSSEEAISIPLFNQLSFQNQSGMTRTDLLQCWKDVADVLANPRIKKIGQNFKFDERQLENCLDGRLFFGMKVNGFWFDTLLAFRTLYPELPGRLEFITSVLTKEPYYKEEGKGFNPKKDKLDRLLLYNAKDAAVTFEAHEEELKELRERKLEGFFFNRVMPLHPFYSRSESVGIRRDDFQQKFLLEKYKDQVKELQNELNTSCLPFTGDPNKILNVNSNGAKGDMPWLVFIALGFPPRKSTDEKTLGALMRNNCKDPIKKRILELILKIRKVRKTIGTYIEAEADYRGRLLTSVRIMLETGRTSTGILKTPITTHPMGWAMQTVTKHGDVGTDIRSMCIPDEGCVLVEPDLSGAEARVVAILARDERLIKIFRYNLDVHRITRAWMLNNAPDELLNKFYSEANHEACIALAEEINKILKGLINIEDRQIGKVFRHAGHYDMGKRVASINAQCSEWRAGQILERFHATNPNIRKVYHKEIQDALQKDRTLVNPFGRTRVFLDRWGDELFKEAYAQIPQSTVSDQTKSAAIRIERRLDYKIQILGESHDSFLAQVPIPLVDRMIRVTKEELEQPIDFKICTLSRGELIIPCEISLGDKNWELMKKIA